MKKIILAICSLTLTDLTGCGTQGNDTSSSTSSLGSTAVTSSSTPASKPTVTSSSSSGPIGVRPAKLEGFGQATTGGQGGKVVYASTGTEINSALCGRASLTDPIIIMVKGTINHNNTTAQGCNTADDKIEIKATQNVSIIGVGAGALFDELGIHLRDASNVIIQNVHIRNVKKSGSPTSNGGDAIGMESGVDRVWIDHNELEASGGEKDGYDSLLDMKAGVTNVTVSYNEYHDSSRGGLVGSSDSDDKNTNITFHHNWYRNIDQRVPLLRHGTVHSYNNYISNLSIHGMNARMGGRIRIEGNYFENVNNPIIASDDSPQAGCWETGENTFVPKPSYSRSVGNGALVIGEVINGQVTSTCSVSIPYQYSLDPSQDVPEIIKANVGVGKLN